MTAGMLALPLYLIAALLLLHMISLTNSVIALKKAVIALQEGA